MSTRNSYKLIFGNEPKIALLLRGHIRGSFKNSQLYKDKLAFNKDVMEQEGIAEVYDFETDEERKYKLAVTYSGDYHELRELENNEVSLAIKIPGLVILKPLEG